jgi:two-component system alkaline phosphatase synthesis response regulator PhoP
MDGEEGREKATHLPFDLIILDIMLPHRSGLDICMDIRRAGLATPILLLTARGQTSDKVVGFKLGADDYVTKPFDTLELMARVEALLRRVPTKTVTAAQAEHGIHQFGPIVVDIKGTQVTRNGQRVYLTAREFELLRYFVEHQGITLSRDELLREVWGHETGTFTRTVDVHVASLRQKLENIPKKPEMILTIPGLGYKFQP